MDQTINTRQDADECTELGQGDDRSMEGAADGVVVLQLLPGVVLGLLVAQRDLVVLGVDVLHIHLDGIANGDDLGGMLDAVPAQLADVAQTVHTADIDECTVRSQALDNAGVGLAHLNVCPELFTLCLVLLSGHLVDAADDLAAGALGDNQLNVLANQSGVVLITAHSSLRTRNEHLDALDVDHNAALVELGDVALDDLAGLSGLSDLFHALARCELLAGELDDAILIHNLLDDEVQLIANLHQVFDLGGGIIGQLAQLDKAGLLRSDIHLDLVGRDAGHDSFHNTACMNTLFLGCIQHLLKAHAVIDFCAHTVKYLLNNRRWR